MNELEREIFRMNAKHDFDEITAEIESIEETFRVVDMDDIDTDWADNEREYLARRKKKQLLLNRYLNE